MKISEVLNGVYDKSVGWRPSSGSIKPVHIANGLFRDILGEHSDIKRAVGFVIPWKKKNDPEPDTKRTYEYLVHETEDERYSAFLQPQYKDRFENLREFTRGLLGSDQAVFPQPDITSFSLTCRQMISKDQNDREVGRFMAFILRGQDSKGKLGKKVTECLMKDSDKPADPISFLAWPLLSNEPEKISRKSNRCSPYENKKLRDFFDHLEKAADQLADHESSHGNRLATLQRAVHFSCLSLMAHAQALAVNGKLQDRRPLLIAMNAPKGSRLSIASEDSLDLFYASFETWLSHQLAVRLAKGDVIAFGSKDGEEDEYLGDLPATRKDSVRKWLEKIENEKGTEPSKDLIDDRMCLWEQSLAEHGKDDWPLVIAETLVRCYLSEYTSGGPRPFIGGVGRKAGIIFPHFQGRSKEKRIKPSVSMLDVLVKSCVPVENPIPFNDFLENAWNRFGLICGGRLDEKNGDHAMLSNHGIEVSKSDLEENSQALIDELVHIGLARRYPDNITFVGKYNA